MPTRHRLGDTQLDQFRLRVVQDALTQAEAQQWRTRAQVFDDAAPQPGDYNGQATDDDLARAAHRCASVALACRINALMLDPRDFWEKS